MEYFSIVYKILKAIYYSMDYEEFDENSISPETLNVSVPKWEAIMRELVEQGYVKGVSLIPIAGREKGVKVIRPTLTMKGVEYLEENSMMKKAQRFLKGIKDIAPGM